MENQELIDLISGKSSEHTIRDFVKNLEIKTDKGKGFICGTIYYIIFKDLHALYRRICEEENSINPVSVKYTDKDNCFFKGWAEDQVAKMNPDTQTLIFICVYGIDGSAIAPILAGVFDTL